MVAITKYIRDDCIDDCFGGNWFEPDSVSGFEMASILQPYRRFAIL